MIRKAHSYATPLLAITLVSLTGCISNPTVTDNNASVKVAGYTATARNHLEEDGAIKVNREDLHELLIVRWADLSHQASESTAIEAEASKQATREKLNQLDDAFLN